ncbi:MAG: major facilitator superfamily 1 [Anaerolineales bacterium]|nr:major facilitator superfamily MFS 1 [Anaerolineales bacterium]MBM2842641.1 major facilitator superfamily 1 [Anaerolineales bacterium]
MTRRRSSRRFVLGTFFVFIFLHQTDRLLISPLTTDVMATFSITKTQMGMVSSAALLVGGVLFLAWGYLYDRYARAPLLALASAVWGATTWLSARAPTFPTFLVTRASTGIDDSSYPGLYSLIADYFGPAVRGRIYGMLQLAQPMGFLAATVLALTLGKSLGWRSLFLITGTAGIILAFVIYFGVREPPRGQSEPELQGIEQTGRYRFDRRQAAALLRKRSLLLLFAQGFVGVFPWNVITFWFFAYLELERGYDEMQILLTMAPAVLVLSAGYVVGGSLGDRAFRRTPRGRLLVSAVGVLVGAVFLTATMSVPSTQPGLFLALLLVTALFVPFASPNVVSTVQDITLPEVRSTAISVQSFVEEGGAALAPFLAGWLADQSSLHYAILTICVSAWLIGSVFLAFAARAVPHDIETLRSQLRERAALERAAAPSTEATRSA